METKVFSIGGSVLFPKDQKKSVLQQTIELIKSYGQANQRLVFVIGGGALARAYQNYYLDEHRDGQNNVSDYADEIGIACTRANAQVFTHLLGVHEPLITDPSEPLPQSSRVISGGWKPGFSTDYVSVYLAIAYQSSCVFNLSNIDYIYSGDPHGEQAVDKLTKLTWSEFENLGNKHWSAGMHTPFDPVASALARAQKMQVYCGSGQNPQVIQSILEDTYKKEFIGSVISGD